MSTTDHAAELDEPRSIELSIGGMTCASCAARIWPGTSAIGTTPTASGVATGITAGIDESGALLVQTGDTVTRLVAGEVRWD